jgi:hypothetical protein
MWSIVVGCLRALSPLLACLILRYVDASVGYYFLYVDLVCVWVWVGGWKGGGLNVRV